MLMIEFTERTGVIPTDEEYAVIEDMYYDFDGDKDLFCKLFMKRDMMREVHRELTDIARAKTENLSRALEAANKRIARLEAQLEHELEWKPWSNKKAVKQEDYDRLRKFGHEMTDDEARDKIAVEWGFDRSKIRILRKLNTFEINRHSALRQAGEIDRDPYYEASDWYYILFRICGMEYEAYNGTLTHL